MYKRDRLLITSNNRPPEPCSDYEKESGICKYFGKQCDACYENSLNIWKNEDINGQKKD